MGNILFSFENHFSIEVIDMAEPRHKNWQEYWSDVAPRLVKYLTENQNELLIKYLNNSFAIFSFLTEDWDQKTTKHADLRPKLTIFLVEIHDIMRGIIACYEHQTLAPLALLLRTAFEIRANLTYILKSETPEVLVDIFDRFQDVEQVLARKSSLTVASPTSEEMDTVIKRCPEWFHNGKPIESMPHWTGIKGMNLYRICEASHVNLKENYIGIYKVNSKFTHASPLIRNMYRNNGALGSIPRPDQSIAFAALAMGQCMEALMLSCEFFGVDFPEYEYLLVCQDMLEATGQKRLDPKDYPNK